MFELKKFVTALFMNYDVSIGSENQEYMLTF
jgi:hypothetical protein